MANATVTLRYGFGMRSKTPSVQTDSNGMFRLVDIPAGKKDIVVNAEVQSNDGITFTGTNITQRNVTVPSSGEVRHDMEIVYNRIYGKVVDQKTGKPIPYCQFQFGRFLENSFGVQDTETDEEGRFSLESIGFGRHAFFIRDHEGYADTLEAVVITEESPVQEMTIELTSNFGTVEGQVVNEETGEPANMLPINCIPVTEEPLKPEELTLHRTMLQNGRYKFSNVVAGKYRLMFNGSYQGYALIFSEPFDVQDGETIMQDFSISKGTSINLQFVDKEGKRLERSADNHFEAFLHFDYEISIPISSETVVLNPGEYRVTASLGDGETVEHILAVEDGDPAQVLAISVQE